MKKYILLAVTIFLCTSCFNYVEINNLVLITGIGIDYEDNNYVLSVEALYQNKENSESNFDWGVIKKVTGSSLSDAFNNLSLKLERKPYYSHLKVIIISEEVAKNHINDLFDYFLRNNNMRNVFSLVVADGQKPDEILSSSNKYYPVVSEEIRDLLENNTISKNINKNLYFKNIANNYLSNKKDIYLLMIKTNNDFVTISKIMTFSNNNFSGYLNNDLLNAFSIISSKNPNVLIKHECGDNKYITANIYKNSLKYIVNKNSLHVISNLSGEIIENNCNIHLVNADEYNKISHIFKNIIGKQYSEFFNYIKDSNSDIIGINKMYLNKYRRKNKKYFKEVNIIFKFNIELNKNGLIFEVNKHE